MLNTGEIRRRRESLRLTLEEAAERASFNGRQQWFGIENGSRTNPTLKTLNAVAGVLGCRVADILIEVSAAAGRV